MNTETFNELKKDLLSFFSPSIVSYKDVILIEDATIPGRGRFYNALLKGKKICVVLLNPSYTDGYEVFTTVHELCHYIHALCTGEIRKECNKIEMEFIAVTMCEIYCKSKSISYLHPRPSKSKGPPEWREALARAIADKKSGYTYLKCLMADKINLEMV